MKRYAAPLLYAVLYLSLLLWMHWRHGFGVGEPLLVLGIVGVGFTTLAYWSTRRLEARTVPVMHPRAESRALLVYWLLTVVFITWGLPAVRGWAANGWESTVAVLVAKLVVFVAVPAFLWKRHWGYHLADFAVLRRGFGGGHWRPVLLMSAVLIAFQLVFGRVRGDVGMLAPTWGELAIGLGLGFGWLLLEVGLVEEFFFRSLIQARLAAWTRSDVTAIVLMAVLFGLAHAPGLYLRPDSTGEALGTEPSLLFAIGYSIVVTSVTGFFLGTLWVRTRNLLALAVIHAAGDLLPNLADTIRIWRPGG